jgi:hypothetical protein
VSEYVDGLEGKHAVYLVFNGGSGNLCDMIGLGFSSNEHEIERYVSPSVRIQVDGAEQTIPTEPIRSSDQNGIVDGFRYQVSASRPDGSAAITASASDPNVKVMITQASEGGAGIVRFFYNDVMKLYRLFQNFTNVAAPEADEEDAAAIIEADSIIGNTVTIDGSGFETPAEKIVSANAVLEASIGALGVDYELTHVGGDHYALTYAQGNTTMRIDPFFIVVDVTPYPVNGYVAILARIEKPALAVNESTGAKIFGVREDGLEVDITTGDALLKVEVADTTIASYANGTLTAKALGKTNLVATYDDPTDEWPSLPVIRPEFTVGEVIKPTATAIYVNGSAIPNFVPTVKNYTFAAPVAPELSVIVEAEGEGLSHDVVLPEALPGTATVTVSSVWGETGTYSIYISNAVSFNAGQKSFTVDVGNPSDDDKEIYVLLAAYDDSGKLAELAQTELLTVPANGSLEDIEVALEGDIKEQTVKAFIWDGAFAPYTSVYLLKNPEYSIFPILFENGQLNGFGSRGGADLSVVDTTRRNGAAGKAVYVGPDRETWGGSQIGVTEYLTQPGQEYEFVIYVRSEGAVSSQFSLTAQIDAPGENTQYFHINDRDISAADGWVRFSGSRVFNEGETINVYVENSDLNAFFIDEFSILVNGRPA